MPKFTFMLVVALAVSVIQGFPTFEDDVAAAAASGDWAKVHDILRKSFNFQPYKGIDAADVRSLKPAGGGHVYAEAESSFKQFSNVNGHVDQESGGHKVVNNDGQVKEWDFKP